MEQYNLNVFSERQQDAIIGLMLKDSHFFVRCVALLKHTWFTSPINGELFVMCQTHFDKYKRPPTDSELKSTLNITHANNYRKYYDRIDQCAVTCRDFGKDFMSVEMTGWMKMVQMKESLQGAAEIFNKKDWSAALVWIDKKIAEVKQTSFISDKKVSFTDSVEFLMSRDLEHQDCLTIGHPDFDKLLREGAGKPDANRNSVYAKDWTYGGLVKGDSTMILGPSNSGKTTTLTSIIMPNVINGKHVLYFTHEQKWEDIKVKLLMNACKATITELKNPDDGLKNRIKFMSNFLEEYLVYVPWIKTGDMYVESVMAEINMQQEILWSKKGVKFDMLVDDYPAKLKSQQFKGKAIYEEIDYVYDQFVTMATEHRFHAILPVQTNRDGYKTNRGDAQEERVIDQADAAGSFGTMQKADNVISLNRKPSDQQVNHMRFYISKSRTQRAQTMFVSKTDFARSMTHGIGLDCMSEERDISSEEAKTSMAQMYPNKNIPQT